MTVIDVRDLRRSLGLSRPKFASQFGFNVSTVRQWEEGRRSPDAAGRALLAVIKIAPEIVREAVAAAA